MMVAFMNIRYLFLKINDYGAVPIKVSFLTDSFRREKNSFWMNPA